MPIRASEAGSGTAVTWMLSNWWRPGAGFVGVPDENAGCVQLTEAEIGETRREVERQEGEIHLIGDERLHDRAAAGRRTGERDLGIGLPDVGGVLKRNSRARSIDTRSKWRAVVTAQGDGRRPKRRQGRRDDTRARGRVRCVSSPSPSPDPRAEVTVADAAREYPQRHVWAGRHCPDPVAVRMTSSNVSTSGPRDLVMPTTAARDSKAMPSVEILRMIHSKMMGPGIREVGSRLPGVERTAGRGRTRDEPVVGRPVPAPGNTEIRGSVTFRPESDRVSLVARMRHHKILIRVCLVRNSDAAVEHRVLPRATLPIGSQRH